MTTGPVLKYPGSKWRLARWICDHLPPHEVYAEPFFGSGAVLFTKEPAPNETINDLSGDVVNLFSVIRSQPHALAEAVELTPWAREEWQQCRRFSEGDPVERARCFLVRCWQSHGGRIFSGPTWRRRVSEPWSCTREWQRLPGLIVATAERLRDVQIESRPALQVLASHAAPNVLVYADPPYPREVRDRAMYAHEMTYGDHMALLDALCAHPGPVVLSGYRCDQYDGHMARWYRYDRAAAAEAGRQRTESLWLNTAAVDGMERHQVRLPFGAD